MKSDVGEADAQKRRCVQYKLACNTVHTGFKYAISFRIVISLILKLHDFVDGTLESRHIWVKCGNNLLRQ